MNRLKNFARLVLLLVLFIIPFTGRSQDVQVVAIAPTVVEIGESFRLVYSINAKADAISGVKLDEFTILGPSVSDTRLSDGKVEYTYIASAKKEGIYTMPVAIVTVQGKEYISNSVLLHVIPACPKVCGISLNLHADEFFNAMFEAGWVDASPLFKGLGVEDKWNEGVQKQYREDMKYYFLAGTFLNEKSVISITSYKNEICIIQIMFRNQVKSDSIIKMYDLYKSKYGFPKSYYESPAKTQKLYTFKNENWNEWEIKMKIDEYATLNFQIVYYNNLLVNKLVFGADNQGTNNSLNDI